MRIRLLMSDLLKLFEKYFAYQEIQEDNLQSKIKLATTYFKKNLPTQFEKIVQQTESQLKNYPYRNANYYSLRYQLHFENLQYTASHKPSGELRLQDMSNELDIAYLANKLRQACLQQTHQTIYRPGEQQTFPEELINYIQRSDYLDIPLIGIYYNCYHCLVHPEEASYFQQFRKLLFEHGQNFPEREIHDLYKYAINYCVRQINRGAEDYFTEVMSIYKTGLEKGFLLEYNQLTRFTYHNIAAAGMHTGEYEWVDAFIHNYKKKLEKQYQESSFKFNLARLEYSRQNFDKALKLLRSFQHKDLLLNLAAKTLLLKIYFELSEFDLLEAHLEAMKIFLRRKKVQKNIGYHQTNYLNIVQYTKKLLGLNTFDKQARQKLKGSIEAEEILTEKEWLLKQLY
ncbi:MAG: hypothetical protein AAFV25_12965 [Bacteroidota bacterium]